MKITRLIACSIAAMAAGCAPSVVLKGDVPFKSEPISKIYIDLQLENRTGKQIPNNLSANFDSVLSNQMCDTTPGLGKELLGMYQVRVTNAAGDTRDATQDVGKYPSWIEGKFQMFANCCKNTNAGKNTYGMVADLCKKNKFIDEETLILRYYLIQFNEVDYAKTLGVEVLHGKSRTRIGGLECPGPKHCGYRTLAERVLAGLKQ